MAENETGISFICVTVDHGKGASFSQSTFYTDSPGVGSLGKKLRLVMTMRLVPEIRNKSTFGGRGVGVREVPFFPSDPRWGIVLGILGAGA